MTAHSISLSLWVGEVVVEASAVAVGGCFGRCSWSTPFTINFDRWQKGHETRGKTCKVAGVPPG